MFCEHRPLLIGILVGLIIVAVVLFGVMIVGGGLPLLQSSQPAPSQSSESGEPSQSAQSTQLDSSAEQSSSQDAQQNSQQQPMQSGNTQQAPGGVAAAQNPSSVNATNGNVTLKGKLTRQQRTTDQTGMGWASVDYLLVFDSPVEITYQSPRSIETHSFSQIQVSSKEVYAASDPDALKHLDSVSDSNLQPYVGKYVAVTGKITDTGNAHTFGYARFSDYSIVPIQ